LKYLVGPVPFELFQLKYFNSYGIFFYFNANKTKEITCAIIAEIVAGSSKNVNKN